MIEEVTGFVINPPVESLLHQETGILSGTNRELRRHAVLARDALVQSDSLNGCGREPFSFESAIRGEEAHKLAGDDGGVAHRQEMSGVEQDDFRIRNQARRSCSESWRNRCVSFAVKDERRRQHFAQLLRHGAKYFRRISPAKQRHQTPRAGQAVEWSVEVAHYFVTHRLVAHLPGRVVLCESQAHDQLPEKQIDGGRHHLTDDGLTQNFKKRKRLEVGKDGWREERETPHAMRIAMRILDADGAPGVMTHDVPLFYAALDTQSFDRCGQSIQLAETSGQGRGTGRGLADRRRCR
jgi:hypothetical protein